MVFKTTSTKPKRKAGVTLVEFSVATAIASIAAVSLASLVYYSARSFASMANYVVLDHQSRMALDKMSQEIRQANRVISATTTSLTLEDADGGTLEFFWDEKSRELVRRKDGVADSEPLLEDCDSLEFHIFQRNPVGGTYDQYPTANPSTCKLVQLRWVCSKNVLGDLLNSESVQSAKIVIRKQ